jgi:DNA-binding response OmpR family regulator
LTTREFELVAHLARNLDKVVAREALFERVWGYDMAFNSNSLEVYVYRIRKKIEHDPNNPRYLKTVRGFGYSLSG